MTTKAEGQEMIEEARNLIVGRGVHPWPLFQDALKARDRDACEAIIEAGYNKLSARQKIASQSALKRTFPPEPEPFRSAAERREMENESGNNSPLAEVIKRRNESRRNPPGKKYRGSAGVIPLGKEDEYGKPDSGGFNLPPKDDTPSKRGSGREKVRQAFPQDGKPA